MFHSPPSSTSIKFIAKYCQTEQAVELLKGYVPGKIEASAKMSVFFCILEESISLGDRILVFSQSLFTLNLMEELLQQNGIPGKEEKWMKNVNYYSEFNFSDLLLFLINFNCVHVCTLCYIQINISLCLLVSAENCFFFINKIYSALIFKGQYSWF